MNQIDQIRAEIERRLNEDYCGNDIQDLTAQGVCCSLLSFLDTLQEQEPEGLDEAAGKYAPPFITTRENQYKYSYSNHAQREKRKAFKAGAKWAMEHGVIIDGCVSAIADKRWVDLDDDKLDSAMAKFNNDDKVIVQIRKK